MWQTFLPEKMDNLFRNRFRHPAEFLSYNMTIFTGAHRRLSRGCLALTELVQVSSCETEIKWKLITKHFQLFFTVTDINHMYKWICSIIRLAATTLAFRGGLGRFGKYQKIFKDIYKVLLKRTSNSDQYLPRSSEDTKKTTL